VKLREGCLQFCPASGYAEKIALTGAEDFCLKRSIKFLFLAALAGFAVPACGQDASDEHRLRLYHTHTRQHLDVVYRRGGEYVAGALSKLDAFLGDHLTGEIHHFEPRLFDVLSDLMAASGRPEGEISIICGYRAPVTNEYLRTHTSGVAKNSLHMQAEAIDIRLPGVKTSRLRDLAMALGRGGVGYYAASDFIHVDVGRVRRW
jgi:uncharacterized protein YcbK (DUF882 family)